MLKLIIIIIIYLPRVEKIIIMSIGLSVKKAQNK